MTATLPTVSVIIATTCEASRADSLLRAIESVLSQAGAAIELLVIVNGPRRDHKLFDRLARDQRIKLRYLETGSFPAAIRFGREIASGEFFCFVDDDDFYLPGAIQCRLQAIEDPSIDFVATNGYRLRGGAELLFVANPDEVILDPETACYRGNWLASAGGLFRFSSIPVDFFDGRSKYCEWSLLSFRLIAAGKRLKFLNVPTFCIGDTVNSLSKQGGFEPLMAAKLLVEEMLAQAPPRKRRPLLEQYCSTLHDLSHTHLCEGSLREAWSFHFRSLQYLLSLKYLSYTRRLVVGTVRRALPFSRTVSRSEDAQTKSV